MKTKTCHYPAFLPTFRKGNLVKPVSILLIIALLNLMGGCYYYKVITSKDPASDVIRSQQDPTKFIILHFGDQAWEFSEIAVTKVSLVGKISDLQGHEYYRTNRPDQVNRYRRSSKEFKDEREVINEVHITVSEYNALDGNEISIPLEYIEKIEVYDPAIGATIASWVFTGLGVAAIGVGVLLIIVMLTKSSCPFIYVYDGNQYTFCGEIYSGAIFPPLERHDYLPLHNLREKDNLYSIQLKNEVREIQHTNLAELLVIDHFEGTVAYVDKYGNPFAIHETHSPLSATNLQGKDILPQILSKDSLNYFGYEPVKDQDPTDGTIMEFEIPEGTTNAGLVLRAKNTFWLDYVFTRFHGLFGYSYDKYMNKQSDVSRNELIARMLDQQLPVSVYVEKKGKWEFQDYFNIAGPMAMRDDILSLDLNGVSPGPVRVKLDYGLYFWELDYVGLTLDGDQGRKKHVVRLESAIDDKETDVKELLFSDDSLYYIQPEVGDAVEMNFKVPPPGGMQRSVFLHSKGYYKIIRDQTGKTDMKTLRSLKNDSGLPQFSIELIKDLYPPSQN